MSYLSEHEMICSHCQHPTMAEVWTSVNVQEDPELKDLLLGGELNMVECEACKEWFFAEQFLLYHDPANELLAFVYPFDYRSEKEKWVLKTKEDFSQTQNLSSPESRISYPPMTLFGLDELVEAAKHEEEVGIQSEIVSLLSKQNGLKVRELRPSVARELKLPKVLPLHDDNNLNFSAAVLAGLEKITQINDRLFLYSQARDRWRSAPLSGLPA